MAPEKLQEEEESLFSHPETEKEREKAKKERERACEIRAGEGERTGEEWR